jgi:hypothetical protein
LRNSPSTNWLKKHTAVSDEDFSKNPTRNRLAVFLNRTNHASFHTGQIALTKQFRNVASRSQGLLTLDQQAERIKWSDWNEFEPKEAVRGKRQLVDYRLRLIERLGIHQKDHARLILAEPELKFRCHEFRIAFNQSFVAIGT